MNILLPFVITKREHTNLRAQSVKVKYVNFYESFFVTLTIQEVFISDRISSYHITKASKISKLIMYV